MIVKRGFGHSKMDESPFLLVFNKITTEIQGFELMKLKKYFVYLFVIAQ
jgi:hypothetical protein